MDNNRVDLTKYAWVAAVAVFLLVFGGVWLASSPPGDAPQAKADPPDYEGRDQEYASRIPARPSLPPAPVYGVAPPAEAPTVVVTPLTPRTVRRSPAPVAKPRPPKTTVRDMFPVGSITRELPRPPQPQQPAESYPRFEYQGKMWSATGKFVVSNQVDLVPAGPKLPTGQALYAINGGDGGDSVLFVQSETSPDEFAIYRAEG